MEREAMEFDVVIVGDIIDTEIYKGNIPSWENLLNRGVTQH